MADKQQEWQDKLVGKKIVETASSDPNHFSREDLPQGPQAHRVIAPNSIVTRDFRPERLNVHTDDDGVVTHVTFA